MKITIYLDQTVVRAWSVGNQYIMVMVETDSNLHPSGYLLGLVTSCN